MTPSLSKITACSIEIFRILAIKVNNWDKNPESFLSGTIFRKLLK